jgi:hypothetical protein
MTRTSIDGLADGTGRFPFDPLFDAGATPCVTFLMGRVLQALATDGTPERRSLLVARNRFSPLPLTPKWAIHKLLRSVPSLRRAIEARHEAKATEEAMTAILPEIRRIQALCASYGVDPTSHPMLRPSLRAIVSYSIFAPLERETRRLADEGMSQPGSKDQSSELADILDEIDVERRIEERHAGMRSILETEAMAKVVDRAAGSGGTGLMDELRKALPIVRSVDLREGIEKLLKT